MMSGAPPASVPAEVNVIRPAATTGATVMFPDIGTFGMPGEPVLQFAKLPFSCRHKAIAVLIESISLNAPAVRVRDT